MTSKTKEVPKSKLKLIPDLFPIIKEYQKRKEDFNATDITHQVKYNHLTKLNLEDEIDFVHTYVYDGLRPTIAKYLKTIESYNSKRRNKPLFEDYDYMQEHYPIGKGPNTVYRHYSNMNVDNWKETVSRMTKHVNGLIIHRDQIVRFVKESFPEKEYQSILNVITELSNN